MVNGNKSVVKVVEKSKDSGVRNVHLWRVEKHRCKPPNG